MEKKRKLPPRGAAKAETSSKKRASTPSDHRSNTHTPTPAAGSGQQSALPAEMDIDEPPAVPQPEPLPTSIAPGKPLPTVEEPQPDDLPPKDYQSIQESGVLAESILRSRQKWISEGIFEKYWSKPRKIKGATVEDPKNPPKDTMSRLGQVTIIVEPHVFETTMFGVKEVKPPPPLPTTQAQLRPIVQYGPPGGVAPAPMATPPPAKVNPSPTVATATPAPPTPTPAPAPAAAAPSTPAQAPPAPSASTPAPALSQASNTAATQPQQPEVARDVQRPNPSPSPAPNQQPPAPSPIASATAPLPPAATAPAPSPIPAQAAAPSPSLPGPLAAPAPAPAPGPSPINQPIPSPRGMEAVLSPNPSVPQPAPRPAPMPSAVTPGMQHPGMMTPNTSVVGPAIHGPLPPGIPPPPSANRPNGPGPANTVHMPPGAPPGPPRPAGPQQPGADPIILTLAEKATEDPHLRDLMKRVANGQASKSELEGFQAIIDQITAESKRKGAVQGPSADRLVVDGRTVRYFADEVRAILDIVFASNPKQTSADLRPPAGSDPLVVALVKSALDDMKVRDMVRRIAENRPQFSDATDLKHVLDRLKNKVIRDQERQRTQSPAVALKPNGVPPPGASGSVPATPAPPAAHPAPRQQALRSNGPPPVSLPAYSGVVFEFTGGNGDRYQFPKFSVVEFIQSPQGQQLVASFIIVRKGSTSEHGGDPDLDYYQPITIRLLATTHRHLEIIPRIVAPVEEVRSYMNDVMSHMTRAEYVLLAMRLPRKDKEDDATTEKEPTPATATVTPNGELKIRQVQPMQGVLWTTPAQVTPSQKKPVKKSQTEDEQYQEMIKKLTPRDVEEV